MYAHKYCNIILQCVVICNWQRNLWYYEYDAFNESIYDLTSLSEESMKYRFDLRISNYATLDIRDTHR